MENLNLDTYAQVFANAIGLSALVYAVPYLVSMGIKFFFNIAK